MKKLRTLINGEETDLISISDRSVNYGDGLFETLKIDKGEPVFWQRHLKRLFESCDRLMLPRPDEQLLFKEVRLLSQSTSKGVLKIIYTRGTGDRGYRIPQSACPTRILSVYDWPQHAAADPAAGVEIRVCNTRLSTNPLVAGLKHLNRIEQVMARSEWPQGDRIYEGLMLDYNDYVIECTSSNLFIVRDKLLVTPDLSGCGVSGIIRGLIIDSAAEQNLEVQISNVTLPDLLQADEVFICNSVAGIVPVCCIENTRFTSWPVTLELVSLLHKKELENRELENKELNEFQ